MMCWLAGSSRHDRTSALASRSRRLAPFAHMSVTQNYPLQLSGATVRVAIAVRLLQVQTPRRAAARLQKRRLQLNGRRYADSGVRPAPMPSIVAHAVAGA